MSDSTALTAPIDASVEPESFTIDVAGEPMTWKRVSAAEATRLAGYPMRTPAYVSDRDSADFVPEPGQYVGRIIPNTYCRFWSRKRTKYCRATAGRGTAHPGRGRCRKHAGGSGGADDVRIKHGLRGAFVDANKAIIEKIERHLNDPELLSMQRDVAMYAALIQEELAKPDDEMSRERLSRYIAESNRMKDRIHTLAQKSAYSMDDMARLWRAQRHTIEIVLGDHPELATKLLETLAKIAI